MGQKKTCHGLDCLLIFAKISPKTDEWFCPKMNSGQVHLKHFAG
jgi:hypothetical protein